MRARETIRKEEEKAQAAAKLEERSLKNAAEVRPPGRNTAKMNAANKKQQQQSV